MWMSLENQKQLILASRFIKQFNECLVFGLFVSLCLSKTHFAVVFFFIIFYGYLVVQCTQCKAPSKNWLIGLVFIHWNIAIEFIDDLKMGLINISNVFIELFFWFIIIIANNCLFFWFCYSFFSFKNHMKNTKQTNFGSICYIVKSGEKKENAWLKIIFGNANTRETNSNEILCVYK